jgi:DNA-binding transcriptional LysR family regulator
MDRLDAMSVLVAVAENGSFSAAARKLGTPLPTVSRKISELEARLNARLLTRTTRRLSLTDAGEAYIAACKRILEQVAEAERAASGEYVTPRGDLVIAAPIVFGRLHVLPAVNEFLRQYPDIDVRLTLSDRNVQLLDDHIDLAVRIGALADSGMVATRVGGLRRVVCASPGYLASVGTPKVPEDLAALSCVNFDSFTSSSAWTFSGGEAGGAERTVAIHTRLAVNTAEAAVDAAIAGVGVTRVLSYQAAHAVAEGKLKIFLAAYEPERAPINLVYVGQSLLPRKTRAFLDFVAPRIRERAAQVDAKTR